MSHRRSNPTLDTPPWPVAGRNVRGAPPGPGRGVIPGLVSFGKCRPCRMWAKKEICYRAGDLADIDLGRIVKYGGMAEIKTRTAAVTLAGDSGRRGIETPCLARRPGFRATAV